jgi:hypothetical protein
VSQLHGHDVFWVRDLETAVQLLLFVLAESRGHHSIVELQLNRADCLVNATGDLKKSSISGLLYLLAAKQLLKSLREFEVCSASVLTAQGQFPECAQYIVACVTFEFARWGVCNGSITLTIVTSTSQTSGTTRVTGQTHTRFRRDYVVRHFLLVGMLAGKVLHFEFLIGHGWSLLLNYLVWLGLDNCLLCDSVLVILFILGLFLTN